MNQIINTARTSNSKEPQQKYGLGTVSIKILVRRGGEGRGWGFNRFYGIPISLLGSVVLHYKCNITHNNKEYDVCIYYHPPPIKFVTLSKVIYKGFFKSFIVLYPYRICPEHHFVEIRIENFPSV